MLKDPNQWAPAATIDAIPVEIVIEITASDGIKKTDYYTITRFRPFLLLEEEDYFVIWKFRGSKSCFRSILKDKQYLQISWKLKIRIFKHFIKIGVENIWLAHEKLKSQKF